MGNPCFHFKQFDICHDRCAMKVGTDGVLLGAWAQTDTSGRILDIGTGSGLIALMMAQRTQASIDALEIDRAGAEQARDNVLKSPWSERIHVVCTNAVTWQAEPYDLILSNPPFYRNALKTPIPERKLARHDDTLTWEQLTKLAGRLLSPAGRLSVVLPVDAEGVFTSLCWQQMLYLSRRCAVSTICGHPPKRLLLEFSNEKRSIQHSSLSVETPEHYRTPEFSALMADFYL